MVLLSILAILFSFSSLLHAADSWVSYRAGGLYGYPGDNRKITGRWEDRYRTYYRSVPPEESWKIPWKEERENLERIWRMLDDLSIDIRMRKIQPKP